MSRRDDTANSLAPIRDEQLSARNTAGGAQTEESGGDFGAAVTVRRAW